MTAVLNIVGNCVVGQGDRNRDDSGGSEPSDNRPSRLSRPTPTPVKPPPHPLPLLTDDVEENGTSPSPSLSSTLPLRHDEAIARALNPLSAICTVYTDDIAIHGDNEEQLRDNIRTVRSVTSHISDVRLPKPVSANLTTTTIWYMALHPIRELRDVLYQLGYMNILRLVASSPNLVHDLTSNPLFRASVTRRPSLLYDHIASNYPDLINATIQYESHFDETHPHFAALARIPHLRHTLLFEFPHNETDETCRKLIANPELIDMIASNNTLEHYFANNQLEFEIAVQVYSRFPLPPTVHYVPSRHNDARSSSSSSSSNMSSSQPAPPALADEHNPRAILMLGNPDHMRNVIIAELHDNYPMFITPMQSGVISVRFNHDDEWVRDIYLDLSLLLNALIGNDPITRELYAPIIRISFPTPIVYGPNNPVLIPHSDMYNTCAEFTLSVRLYNQSATQIHDRQSHQHSLESLYRLIMVNYGSFILDTIIADTPLLLQLHDNPSYALAFSHDLFAYVRMRNLRPVSLHDNEPYRTPLTNVPSQFTNPLDISHVRLPNDNTHLQHLITLRRELDTHLTFSEVHMLLDIPTVERLHRDVTYVEFLSNIVNVRRTLVLRSQLNLDLADNHTPVHTNPAVLKRPSGQQKNVLASSATSSTASSSSSRAVSAPDIVPAVRPSVPALVDRRVSKCRPAMSRTREREWQLYRRYDMYTNTRTIANQPYSTYYTWLSSYNADDYISDEIVDNDTATDSEVEVESDDYDNDNDSDSDVPPPRIIPVIPQPNPLIPVVIPAVIPVVIPVVNARPSYIDLTLRNNISEPSIHTRVFTDPLTPPARNTRAQLAELKPSPLAPTSKKAKPSAQPSLLPTR